MVGMLGLAFIVSFRSLTRFSVPLLPRPQYLMRLVQRYERERDDRGRERER